MNQSYLFLMVVLTAANTVILALGLFIVNDFRRRIERLEGFLMPGSQGKRRRWFSVL